MSKNLNMGLMLLSSVMLVSGCASSSMYNSPIRFSLEELGSNISDRNGTQNVGYRTSVNISGLSIPQVTGQIINVPGDNLPDLLASPVSTTCSKIIDTRYPSDASYEDVKTIAGVIDELQIINLKKLVSQIKRMAIATATESSDSKQKALALEILDVDQADEAKLNELSTSIDSETKSYLLSEQEKLKELAGFRDKKNLIVTTWEKVVKEKGGFSLGSIFSGNKKSEEKRKGFLVMADLRTSTLVPGDDLATRIGRDKKFGRTGSDSIFSESYITIYSIGAKHIAYSEEIDASDYLGVTLNVTTDQLKLLLSKNIKAFLDQQSLALDVAIARALQAGNRGGVSEPTRQVYEYRFWGDTAMSSSNLAELARMNSYTTIYANRGSIDKIVLNSKAEDTSTQISSCMQVVPKNQPSADFADPAKINYEFCQPLGWNDSKSRIGISNTPAGSWKPDNKACIDLTKPLNSL